LDDFLCGGDISHDLYFIDTVFDNVAQNFEIEDHFVFFEGEVFFQCPVNSVVDLFFGHFWNLQVACLYTG